MRTQVSILHHDYPGQLRDRVKEKLEALTRFNEHVTSMTARLERQGDDHRVEIVAQVSHGPTLVADVLRGGFSAALEEALDRMGSSLKRTNRKRGTERRRSAQQIA
jgi:ribosomal subunit interface protein